MKKFLLSIASLAFASMAYAQTVYFSENFNSGSGAALPTGFSQANTPGDTMGWRCGTLATSSEGSSYFGTNHPSGSSRMVVTNDDKYNDDKSNGNLILPPIDLTTATGTTYLLFDQLFYGGNYNNAGREKAWVSYSTNGGTSYTLLDSIKPNNDELMESKAMNISSLNGQAAVIFKFTYSDGNNWNYGLALDNIKVLKPLDRDARNVSLNFTSRFTKANVGVPTVITVQNLGANPITSLNVAYVYSGGSVVNNTMTLPTPIPYTGLADVTLQNPLTLPASGQYLVTCYITGVNGGTDLNASNDTAAAKTLIGCNSSGSKEALIEKFTSSTCPPCAAYNANTFDAWYSNNGPNNGTSRINMVNYQMNWPSPGNDPSYNAHGSTRRNFYGVTGIPDVFTDGQPSNSTASALSAECAASQAKDGFVEITSKLTIGASDAAKAEFSVTPYFTWNNTTSSPIKVHAAILEKEYNYPGASTSQKNYKEVMRKMLPDGNGTTIANFTSGTPQNFTLNTTLPSSNPNIPTQNSFNLWTNIENTRLLVFVQDNATKEILNSKIVNASYPSSVEQINENVGVMVYPNPTTADVTVGVQLKRAENVAIQVLDIAGKVVYNTESQQLNEGKNAIRINTASFTNGTYVVRILTPTGTISKTFTKQ